MKNALLRFVVAGILIIGGLAGCSGGGGGGGTVTAENSVVAAVRGAAPVSACPGGGIQVDTGIDDNGNSVLDPAEVDSTQYVCNGTSGANGSSGVSALVSVTSEPAGANCASGGKKVSVGLDANGNSILDSSEITSSDYICNGTNGTTGTNGTSGTNGTDGTNGLNSLVSIVSEPVGVNCAAGGLKITSGVDANGNGILDPGEAGTPSYICNGNTAPVADAGPDQKVAAAGTLVILNGSGSADQDGNTLTYAWSFTARPVGSLTALSSDIISNPTFTPDKAGKYELSLMVNDGTVSSPADTVTIRAGMPVPDTGQTRWYSTAFGDDGDYTINPLSYTDNGDGTILDNVTGLTWQKCSLGQSGPDCATGTAATYYWDTAGTSCGSLNLAGTGWRLPTDFELTTIVDYGIYGPAINTAYFPNTMSSSYWSSTSYAAGTTAAWYVYFAIGSTYGDDKMVTYYVRCVRGQ